MLEILNFFAEDAKLTSKDTGIISVNSNNVLISVLNVAYFVAGMVAVLVIIVGAYQFVIGGSKPDSVEKARQAILYAVVGIIIIIGAAAITNFVIGSV